MKKITKYSLLTLAIFGVSIISSCKKEPVPKTKTELLTAKAWKISELTVSPGLNIGGVTVTDWFSQFDPCEKDDLFLYKNNGAGINDQGPTKCNPSDPQTTSFTWVFNPDETKITEDNTETYDIIQLDESTFKCSQDVDGVDIGGTPGLKYKLTVTYKH